MDRLSVRFRAPLPVVPRDMKTAQEIGTLRIMRGLFIGLGLGWVVCLIGSGDLRGIGTWIHVRGHDANLGGEASPTNKRLVDVAFRAGSPTNAASGIHADPLLLSRHVLQGIAGHSVDGPLIHRFGT